ncbi:hypothetical protein [Natronorubrum thiooxidans]|nr:hypothetical protein [Natronorubrum thiooxidans]
MARSLATTGKNTHEILRHTEPHPGEQLEFDDGQSPELASDDEEPAGTNR